ncbi:MAG: hypothetical protein VCD66_15970 [Alphaproteobacteria bacterium]|jgi:hypothetical protein
MSAPVNPETELPTISDLETHMLDADGAVQALVLLAEHPQDIQNNSNAIMRALCRLEDHHKEMRDTWEAVLKQRHAERAGS